MITFPSVKSAADKGARVLVRPIQRKEWGEDKIDALKKIFGQEVLQLSRCQLGWKQFLPLVIFPEVSIVYIVMYMNLAVSWGALLVFTLQLIKFIIAMPICMVNILLGSYSQKSFIRIWDMAPLFKGIGWSVAIYQLLMQMFNTSAAGLAFIYIPHLFKSEIEWKNCNFEGASDKCYAMFPAKVYEGQCCSQKSPECNYSYIHFSTLDYFRHNVLDLSTSEEIEWTGVDKTWCIGIFIAYFLVFALMIPGFLRFKNLIASIIFGMTLICCIPMYIVNFIMSSKYPVPENMWSQLGTFTDYKFWVQIVVFVAASEMPGYNVLMGSYATTNITPDVAALVVYTIKFFILTLTLNCFSLAMSLLKEHYRVTNGDCFHVTGYEVLFAVVPDILSRLPLPQIIVPLWLLMIALWGILSTVLIVTAFVETLTDTYPKLVQYRLCICSLVCIVSLLVNVVALHNNYFKFFRNWTQNGVNFTLLFLFASYLIALYVYSLKNIANDYHFIFGVPLKQFWILSIKGASLIVLGCFSLMFFQKFEFVAVKSDFYIDLIMYFLLTLVLAPIPIYAIYIYAMYQASKKKISLINPAASWGPPKLAQKQARKRFNPQREMHYKMEITRCRHNCLLNSTKIKDEIERLSENRQKLIDALGGEDMLK